MCMKILAVSPLKVAYIRDGKEEEKRELVSQYAKYCRESRARLRVKYGINNRY